MGVFMGGPVVMGIVIGSILQGDREFAITNQITRNSAKVSFLIERFE